MGQTDFYDLPFPDPGSTVDIPRDIQSLAQRLELWKNGFEVPAGNVVVGDAAQTTGRAFNIKRLVSGSVYEVTLSCGGATAILTTLLNGNAQSTFVLNQNGNLHTTQGGQTRPVPFATFTARASIPLSNAVGGTVAVPLPAGRFTAPAGANALMVFVSTVRNDCYGYVSAYDNTSVTVGVRQVDNTPVTVTVPVNVLVMQMTATAGPG